MSGGMDRETTYFEKPIKDSGKRDSFETGAVRDVGTDKGAYELISPIFLRRLAIHLERGAKKYAARNWEQGMPMGRTMQSLIRHAFQYLAGDRTEDHLAAIACNIQFLIHYEEAIAAGVLPPQLNDLPDYYNGSEALWLKKIEKNDRSKSNT